MGVIDGLMFAFAVTKQKPEQRWLEECTKGLKVDQLTAIVTKYITTNPEQWHMNANVLVYDALDQLRNKVTLISLLYLEEMQGATVLLANYFLLPSPPSYLP